MRIEINPKYQYLSEWVKHLPGTFDLSGDIIYNARNQIRVFHSDAYPSLTLCVKRFHRPRFLNAFIYGTLRVSKAERSYKNALYCIEHQVATPEPVAFIEEKSGPCLGYSYLVTLQSQLTRLNREFTLAYTPALDLTIRPLAQFTAHMHNEGILHLDFSPGNILWDKVDDIPNGTFLSRYGDYAFEIIDINRMRIGEVSMKEGCKSLRRICARTSFFDTFADEYAKARGMNNDECRYWIHHYRNLFWHNGTKAQYEYE
ncbi:MAG: hypothetical protein IJS00_00350 [Paludibacteraceae bacterium]|nr:hypothetical protein [Paludibacteraceae bacterium]